MTGLGSVFLNAPTGADLLPGVVESVTDDVLVVRVGGGTLECECLLSYTPLQGDSVWMMRHGGYALVIGSARKTPPPLTCTVTSTTVDGFPDLISVVDDNGNDFNVPYLSTYTPTVNDVVAMDWSSTKGFVLGVRGTAAGSFPGFNPGLPGAPASGTDTFPAIYAATWRSGWEAESYGVRQGDWGGYGQNYGAFFYGGAVQQKLAGATALEAKIWMPRDRGGQNAGQTAHLYRHTSDFQPGGDVARIDGPYDVTSPPTYQSDWIPISTTLVQNIIIGGPGGVAIAGDPYIVLKSRTGQRNSDPMVGALNIKWNR